MPTVPTYDNNVQQTRALPNAQQSSIASPELFAGMTQAGNMNKVAQGLNNFGAIIQKREEELDTATALNAEVATREAYMQFQTEARTRRGLAADGLAKDAEKWWEETARKATEKMTPNQQRLYVERLRGVRLSTLDSLSQYQDAQVRAAKQEGALASIDSSIKLALDDPNNAGLASEAMRTIQITVSKLAAENGDAPEKAQMDMLKYTSQYHSGMLQNMIDGNPERAREYMNKYGAQMLPAARGQFDKSLEVAERNVKVFGEVSTAMGTAKSETEALSMVREKFANDADGMKLAVNEVKTRFKEQEDAQQQAQKQAFDRSWTIAVEQGKGRRGVDAQTWSMLTPQQRDSIDDELYQRNERVRVANDRAETKREKQNTDAAWENYYAIRQQARDNPQAFMNRDLREDFRLIPKEKREELIDLQAKKPDELKDVTTLDGQISLTVGALGIEKIEKYKFESVVRDAVLSEQKKQGKPLNQEARQKIIDRMVIDGEVPGGAWYRNDKEGRAFEFYGTPDANKFIPSDDAIKQRFEKNKGRAPTSEELKAIKANLANKG
ncbi:hypothetical protein [Methylotenera sp.]|uniref:hypothetical protein n=1 Tax=Methylotenera sp. TaxID=2051956 RepID=UPI002ED8477E